MFVEFVNDIKVVAKEHNYKVDLYSPPVAKPVERLDDIMTEYSKKKKRSTLPVPDSFGFVSHRQHDTSFMTGKFRFSNIDQSVLEDVTEAKKDLKVTIETVEDGLILEV
jgi:hypothetical protein